MWTLLALIGGSFVVWLLVSPFAAWAQAGNLRALREEVARLREEVGALRRAASDAAGSRQAEAPSPAALPPAEPEPTPPLVPAEAEPLAATPSAVTDEAQSRSVSSLESQIASRWMVWVGAVALALGAVFLVRYSIERGWFGPAVRILAGLGLGALLSAAGEWLRRRPELRPVAGLKPHHVPAAVAGGGLAAFFATIYAAHALYGFVGTAPAFVALAAVALATVAMALLHGPAFALFGILAGFAVPALLQSPDPWPWNVFPYLAAIAAAGLVLVRARGWWWLGWVTMALALLWALVWIIDVRTSADAVVIGGYLIVLAVLVSLARRGLVPPSPPETGFLAWMLGLARRDPFVLGALAAVSLVMLVLVDRTTYAPEVLVGALALACCLIWIARVHPSAEGGAVVAALFGVLMLLAWRTALPGDAAIRAELMALARPDVLLPIVPPSLRLYALMAGALGVVFGAGGYVLSRGARTPALWGTLSAAMPLVVLMLTYVATRGFEADRAWAATALALSLLALLAAERVSRRREEPGAEGVLGAYAAAVCVALGLAAALWLRQAWLTVAFAAMLPALAWVHGRLPLPALRWVAWLGAGIVLVRLLLNRSVLDYALGADPSFGWVLYGYGLPSACFLLAARGFGGRPRDWLVLTLQAGALAFGMALIAFETRLIVAGSLTTVYYGLLERSLHTLAWLVVGSLLLRAGRGRDNPIIYWGARVLLGAAGIHVVIGHLLIDNPLLAYEFVQGWVVLNVLSLAYAAPALIAALIALEARRQGDHVVLWSAGIATLVLPFVYLTMEIRHVFQGAIMNEYAPGNAELYAYSVAWLVYGGALLAIALLTRAVAVRYASLAVIVIVVAKVFLWDLASLTGIMRSLSFLGLGVALVGVGYVYQRFVFRPAARP